MSAAATLAKDEILSVNEIVLRALEKTGVEPPPDDEGLKKLREMQYYFPRWLDENRWAALMPFMFTVAIVWGFRGDGQGLCYEDRWCYHEPLRALLALREWNGAGDPEGWHRHPYSGRRRNEKG